MKKILVALAASAAVVSTFSVSAADGTINFTGSISNQTCTIEGSTGTTAKTVAMERVAASSMAAVGQAAGRKDFTLALTGCTGSSALVRFEQGATVDAATGNLINQTADGSNVQIQILNENLVPINLQTNANSLSTAITDEAASMKFYAQYIAATAAATAGQVTSSVQFSMDYN
ncbi:fimbrial protein [Pseudomonas mucidolens]|uniref:Major type 1 subunit fimbrin (Pilin) n=1 Tax=Pseudomonas mucidolens TaxID=46679 RepID=A0A1H2N7X8_9PSED|nr:fimbrial protein [Pseudomonas mucidolens]SDV00896.1 major type 1 subunit fimbrin (pilin) [Pseudomonas mucidolens]SQH32562.1 fimbrial subunit protein [Pseudomonas mucidolens]